MIENAKTQLKKMYHDMQTKASQIKTSLNQLKHKGNKISVKTISFVMMSVDPFTYHHVMSIH